MTTPEQLIMEARRLIGVPFLHQGRSIESGVDCIGMSLMAADRAGIDLLTLTGVRIPSNYGRAPSPFLLETVSKHCRRLVALRPGALLAFRMGFTRFPHHFALYTDIGTFIHADSASKKEVVEQTLGKPWTRLLHSIWALPGVAYPEDAS